MTSHTDDEDVDGDNLCPVCDEREPTTTVAKGDEVCADCATMFGSVRSDSGSGGSNPRSDDDTSDTPHPHERVADRLRELSPG
jgi:transcription initiation factor TFIIIB Brf1 subunit/transcription initiation factor TFIIB